MSHDHSDHHTEPPSDIELRVKSLESLLVEKGLVDPATLETLIDTYIKPMLIWYSQATLIPYIAFQISNGGIYKHRAENSDTATQEEIDSLVDQAKITAEFYTQRFINFMDQNSSDYPLYTTSQEGGMNPERDQNFTGWVL